MNNTLRFLLGVGVAVAVAGIVFRETVKEAATAVSDINVDTPFEGTGVVGTLGNVTDAASGRQLSRFGSFLGLQGSKLANFFRTGEFK